MVYLSDSELHTSHQHLKRASSPSPSLYTFYPPLSCSNIIHPLPHPFSSLTTSSPQSSSLTTITNTITTTTMTTTTSMDQFETEALQAIHATITQHMRSEQDLYSRHLRKLQTLRASHLGQLQTLVLDQSKIRKQLVHDAGLTLRVHAKEAEEEKEEEEEEEEEEEGKRKAVEEKGRIQEEELELQKERCSRLKEECRELQANMSLLLGQYFSQQQQQQQQQQHHHHQQEYHHQQLQRGHRGGFRGYRGRGSGRGGLQYRWRGRGLPRHHPYQPDHQYQQQQSQFGEFDDPLQFEEPTAFAHHFMNKLDDMIAKDHPPRIHQSQIPSPQPLDQRHTQNQNQDEGQDLEEGAWSPPVRT